MRTSRPAALAVAFGIALLVACGGAIPAAVQYVDTIPAQPRIGDITTVRFRAIDARGEAMGGAELHFSLPDAGQTGGITLNPESAITNKSDGMGSTQIIASGLRVASVVIEAHAGPLIAVSPPITFSGANSPNGKQFTFQCGTIAGAASGGVHALGAFDESRYLVAGVKVNCFAHVGDRNGDGIPNALVSFITEAGTIGASGISMSDVVGNAEVLYKTSYPLPKEVTPTTFTFTLPSPLPSNHTGQLVAPMWMQPYQWTANPILDAYNGVAPLGNNQPEPQRPDPIRPGYVNNCRDNLVTMIAITSGEEGYIDVNNNGTWNTGEPFDDLTEPFVDANDNGTYDSDERWVDTNGNGTWDQKNGQWDGNTLIWVQERILWTGMPGAQDRADAARPVFKQMKPAAGPPNIAHYGFADFEFAVSDPWFNSMAQNGESDGCHIPGIDGSKLINLNPSEFAFGKRMTYPPFQSLLTTITDAHDPLKTPPDPSYGAGVFVQFNVPATCRFTGSPLDGHEVSVPLVFTGAVN